MKGSNNNSNKIINPNIAKMRAQNLTEKVNLDRMQNSNNTNTNSNNINMNSNPMSKKNQIKLEKPNSENPKHLRKPSFNSQYQIESNISKDFESNPINYLSKKN